MPYKLRKSRGRNLYWVVNEETKRKYSKDPLPLHTAEAQIRALYREDNIEFTKKEKNKSKVLRRKLPQRTRTDPGSEKAKERMAHARNFRKLKVEPQE
jgi:hypothetical protein